VQYVLICTNTHDDATLFILYEYPFVLQPDPSLNVTEAAKAVAANDAKGKADAALKVFEATRWNLDARCVDCEALVKAGVPLDAISALQSPGGVGGEAGGASLLTE
jgi:hypothetical protein